MATTKKTEVLTVSAPNIQAIQVRFTGNAPLMQNRFSEKAMHMMADKMTGITKPGSKKAREARDFHEDFVQAKHTARGEEWEGVAASSVRAALISACRLTGFTMTRAKLSLFVPAQGYDKVDGLPLIRVFGESVENTMAVRNATGVADLRCRPLYMEWYCLPEIRFDADQFSVSDVLNLLRRVGLQVGLGEGRPDSRASVGLGFGTFDVSELTPEDEETLASWRKQKSKSK